MLKGKKKLGPNNVNNIESSFGYFVLSLFEWDILLVSGVSLISKGEYMVFDKTELGIICFQKVNTSAVIS